MLIRLLPEQVSEGWNTFAPTVKEALPPFGLSTRSAMVKILEAVLAERATVWVYVTNDTDQVPKYVLVTTVFTDPVTHGQHLLIYAFTGLESLTNEMYVEGLETLKEYAAGLGLASIIAYSRNQPLIRYLKSNLGVKAEFTLIEF